MRRNPRSIGRVLAIAAVAVLLGTPSEAYYHYIHFASRNAPFNPIYEKFDLNALTNKTVSFFVSDQSPAAYGPNDSFGSVLSQVKQAVATWNAVSSSDLRVAFGGLESYTLNPTVTAPGNSVPNSATPGGDVIFVDLPPGIIGMGAPTTSQTPVIGPNGTFFPILRGLVMLSRDTSLGAGPSYFEAFFTTAVHEIGHALGLQHTWTGSAMSQGVIRNTSRARPLDADDIAGLSVLYGKLGWAVGYGSIVGRVTLNNQGVAMASVVAISPTGPVVSTLTNPDGTYRIDGLPPTQVYQVYVHPLPPDGIVPNGEGLRVPVDQNGQPLQPLTGLFQTVFSPGTLNPQQADYIGFNIANGLSIQTVNFAVQPVRALPTYDVVTYARLNTATRTYTWSGDSTVTGAFMNTNQSPDAVIAQASPPAFLPNPQSMTILGGFAPAILNNPLLGQPLVLPYPNQPGNIVAYFYPPLGAGTGPRHLVFNFGTDIYVLPNGVTLVQKGPPLITAALPNPDGTVTVMGAGFGLDSGVYFDGLKANVTVPFSGADALGSITVTPPPGASGQVSTITLYNTDGQNSMILQSQNPPTYTYPVTPAAQIASISVSSLPAASITSLPAASSAAVDIAASNTNFQDGQVTVGFGSDDVVVRRLWVLGPNHLIANVEAVPGATLGFSEISIISGFQVISLPGAFQTQPARLGLPFIGLPVVNADFTQQTIYPGSIASIYGLNLELSPTGVQVTLNDGLVQLQYISATQINFFVPAGFPTGAATLKLLNNGSISAFPVMVQIDSQPPAIASVNNQSNLPLNGSAVGVGEILNVVVTGLDPGVLTNLSRVQVAVSGVTMPLLSVSPLPNGQFQIQFIVTQSFGGALVPLMVWVDGSSSQPVNITVR